VECGKHLPEDARVQQATDMSHQYTFRLQWGSFLVLMAGMARGEDAMSTRLELRVIDGDGKAVETEPIMFSLVHPRGRIDVPRSGVWSIEAITAIPGIESDTCACAQPHVEVWLNAKILGRLAELSAQIVGEALEIVVGDETVAAPIVHAPLGATEIFDISTASFEEALALAYMMRNHWLRPRYEATH
jgi:hypothetical protein